MSEIIGRIKLESKYEDPKITLKLDIEWDEWALLPSIAKNDWKVIDQLIVEFHFIPIEQNKPLSPYFTGFFENVYEQLNEQLWRKYLQVLDKLKEHFEIFHIHANNSLPTHKCFGQRVPYLLEVTWLSRSALQRGVTLQRAQKNVNGQLDYRNKTDRPDVGLSDWDQH